MRCRGQQQRDHHGGCGLTQPLNDERRDGGANPSSRRFLFWLALLAGWLVLLPFLWQGFADVPNADRLEQRHTVGIPTLATLGWTVAKSFLELVGVLVLAWPRGRWYAPRLWLAGLGLAVWFVWSTPLGITSLEWAHRRWLAGMVVGVVAGAIVATVASLIARSRRG